MRKIDIDTSLLRCFQIVADSGSFTAAADKTNLSQSGVSVRIRKLEELLDKQLIHRSSRSFELTPEGEMLLEYARRILGLNDEAVERLRGPGLSGNIRVGLAEYLAPSSLHRILHRFRSHYPQIRLEVVIGLGQDLVPDFERGNFHLAVAGVGTIPQDGELLFEEEMNWVAGVGCLPERSETTQLITLPAPCRFRQAAIDSLDVQGRAWEVSLVCSSVAGVHQGLRAGFGISALPASSIPDDLRPNCIANQFGSLPRHRVAAYRHGPSNPIVERFLEFLKDELDTDRILEDMEYLESGMRTQRGMAFRG